MERNNRKVREGIVVSDKMDKSIVIKVERKMKHPVPETFHQIHGTRREKRVPYR